MKKLAITALTFFSLTGMAHATSVGFLLGATPTDLTYSIGAPALAPNIDLGTTPQLILGPTSSILPGGVNTVNDTSPTGTLYANSYIAVQGPNGSSTFTIAPAQNTFGFTWGTIDNYNTLTLTDSRNVVYTITGDNLINNILGSVGHVTQTDVTFTDLLGTLVSAVFSSTQNAFEVANFGTTVVPVGNVPLPASLPLYLAAIVGLALYARSKKNENNNAAY